MRKFVIREASRRSVYIWNMAGSLINAVRTVVVLALVSRLAGNEAAGIFSLGFSTAQMFYTVAHFETRNVVVVDRGKTFQQDTIVSFRVLTISAMIAASLVFLAFAGFDRQTTTVTALLCLYMAILAIAELSEALFHMFGHLELAGKSLTFDILLGTVFFTLIIWWKQDIAAATIGMTTATVAWIFL